jgi:hypothetical protein
MQSYVAGLLAGLISFILGGFILDRAMVRLRTAHTQVSRRLHLHRLGLSGLLHLVVGVAIATLFSITYTSANGVGKGVVIGLLVWLPIAAASQVVSMYVRLDRTVSLVGLIYWLAITTLDGLIVGILLNK